MIPRNCIPIAHKSPRPPIELNPRHAVTLGGLPGPTPLSPAECDRIWALVKGAAEGSNITAAPRPEVAPAEVETDLYGISPAIIALHALSQQFPEEYTLYFEDGDSKCWMPNRDVCDDGWDAA